MQVVETKMIHPKHEELGSPLKDCPAFMLALILYTGGESNYNLCDSQRKGDYQKWKIFDFCLDTAIRYLTTFQQKKPETSPPY